MRDRGLLTYEEAAERLGYSPQYVRLLTRRGQLGYVVKSWRRGWLLRKKVFIPAEEVLAYELRKMRRIIGSAYREIIGGSPTPGSRKT